MDMSREYFREVIFIRSAEEILNFTFILKISGFISLKKYRINFLHNLIFCFYEHSQET